MINLVGPKKKIQLILAQKLNQFKVIQALLYL